MAYWLFLLLNGVLLLRPEELFPQLTGLRLYLLVIVPTCLLSIPQLLRLLSPASLRTNPVTVCVLLYYAANLLSLATLGRLNEAVTVFGPEFGKVIVYFLLLQAVVDTPGRFRGFVISMVVLVTGLVGIALAQHHGFTHFETIVPCLQKEYDPATGENFILPRLVSTGIFHDPNDLCLVLGLGILSCVYCATTSTGWVTWAAWLIPIPLFVHALMETHSKGGLLGVFAGISAYFYSRFGGPKALPFVAGGAVLALAIIGGRQAEIGGGTAHQRLMFWADGMTSLFTQPGHIPAGLGHGWFVDECGHVAHNSFVQAYVECGLLGGGTFLVAFYLGARILDRAGRGVSVPPWAVQARHYGLAVLVGYAVGCFSLTRNFVVPTYLALGIATILTRQAGEQLPEQFQVSGRWFLWLGALGLVGLLVCKLMTQALGHAGV